MFEFSAIKDLARGAIPATVKGKIQKGRTASLHINGQRRSLQTKNIKKKSTAPYPTKRKVLKETLFRGRNPSKSERKRARKA